jgi:hypothetical protein
MEKRVVELSRLQVKPMYSYCCAFVMLTYFVADEEERGVKLGVRLKP